MAVRELSPWKQAPFLRLLLPLIAGINIQYYFHPALDVIIIITAIIALLFILFRLLKTGARYRYRKLRGVMITFALLVSGMQLLFHRDIQNDSLWFNESYSQDSLLQVRIKDVPVEKPKTFKTIGIIERAINNKNSRPVTGMLVLYFSKEHKPDAGDVLLITKRVERIKNSGNPGSFDYAAYAADRGIYHQVFLKHDDFIVIRKGDQPWFDKFLQESRLFIITQLRKYLNDDPAVIGIAEALIIGYKNDLDKQLLKAYSAAGVVHIIAISGLHLGLIFYMLDFIFKRMPWLRKRKPAKAFMIIFCLWLFALLTGGSASVLRSALMFSFMIVGKTWFRQVSVYNSLTSSAFILLCYNPFYLWDVGFQLSYLAVFGIVWLQRPINNTVYFSNPMLRKIWELASVTLSAQLAAFPICLYYFHQFPVLFLVTNILIVPLSSIILFGGLLLIGFSWLPLLASLLGMLLSFLIDLMNRIVDLFVSIPWSVISNIPSDLPTVILIYILIFLISGFCLWKYKRWLYLSLLFSVVLFSVNSFQYFKAGKQSKIIVYNINGQSAIEFISGRSSVLIADNTIAESSTLYEYNILPSRIHHRLNETQQEMDKGPFRIISFKNTRMLISDSIMNLEPLGDKILLDVLVISGNPTLDISNLASVFKPGLIIFDSSNSLWKIAKWKRDCEQLLLRFHSVPEEGAIILDTG